MASSKKKWVAFRSNATVPGDVLGAEHDLKAQAGEAIQLPAAYADHVVADRFAEFCDPPGKQPKPPKPDDLSELKATLGERDAEIKRLTDAAATQDAEIARLKDAAATQDAEIIRLSEALKDRELAYAEVLVDGLNAELATMNEADEGWAELTAKLDEAVTALAALKPVEDATETPVEAAAT